MVEAFVAFSLLRSVCCRNHLCELHGEARSVHHLALGITSVHTHTLDVHLGTSSVEVLVLQFAEVAAVDGVSPLAAELLDVEVVGTHSDFFVGVEGDAYVAMLHFVVVAQPAHCLHNLSDTCLVVGTEQSGSVGNDDVLADVSLQLRELCRRTDDTFRENDVAAVVILYDAWADIRSTAVGRRVVVRDEANRRNVLLRVCLQRSIDVALLVHLNVAHALALKLLFQILGEDELLRCARHGLRLLARLRIELCVFKKSFGNIHLVVY